MINFEEKITRKSNLELNDSISCYQQHCAQQTHRVYELFYNFLQQIKPTRILEIGTASGGFTLFVAEMCRELGLSTKIRTYDIRPPKWAYDDLIKQKVDIYIEDMFSTPPVQQDVIDFIQQEGTTLILCDGGYKIGEFNTLSNYMKVDDIIMAHDYAESKQVFDEQINKKVWNWLEVTFDDIQESVIRNNLVKYDKINFDIGVWCCFQKV